MLLTQMIFQATGTGDPAAAGPAGIVMQILPLVAIFGIFYFLLIRPQQKRQKEHQSMLSQLKKGDMVVTTGGIIGKIAKISDVEMTLDTGEGGKLRIARHAVTALYNPGEPAPANDAPASQK